MKKTSFTSRMIQSIIKHPLITITCITVTVIVSSVYIYVTPPKYLSTAVLEYTKPNRGESILFTPDKTAATEEITSENFVANAIKNTVNPVSCYTTSDFQTTLTTYTFPYSVICKITSENFEEQSFNIKELNNNSFYLTYRTHGITRTKTGTFGTELNDFGLNLMITKKEKPTFYASEYFQPASYSFTIQATEKIAQKLLSQKDISASDKSGVVTITCRHENMMLAQQITKALSNQFLAAETSGSTATTETPSAIDDKLVNMAIELEETENQIAEYKKQNNITQINFDTEKTLDVLKDLQLQKSHLELNLAVLNNTSDYLRKNREINNSNVEYGTISDPVFSEQIALLNTKYQLKNSGTANATTDTDIEALKVIISERILNTRKKTTVQINRINQQIATVNAQIASLPEKASTLNSLDRKLELDKKVYDLLVEKRAQSIVSGSGFATTAGRILKPATGAVPTGTSPWIILVLGLAAGCFIAIPVTMTAESIRSRSIGNRQELSLQSRIPFIGSVSHIKTGDSQHEQSISALCTRVLLQSDVKMITFASTNKGEGKSFIAKNFAQAFAAMDKKVLVIDMNTDNPSVATEFGVSPERTLADVLSGNCDIHDAICLTSFPNLDVLECGELSSGVNSLLASGNKQSILDSLKKHYDIIVTDTPGTSTQIAAIPMMKMSDLNVYVVRANSTRKQSIVAAEQLHKDFELKNFYFLLNAVNTPAKIKYKSERRSLSRRTDNSVQLTNTRYVPSMLRKIALWFY